MQTKETPAPVAAGHEGASSVNDSAADYTAHGIRLVALKPGTKQPSGKNWQRPGNGITDPANARHLSGIGVHHLDSRTCCIDVDEWAQCEEWFQARGIDLTGLLMADDAVQIQSGKDGRAKLFYKLPEPVDWLPYTTGADGKLELRCANSADSSQQDVLPPSVHPDTGRPYQWGGAGDWRNLPELPDDLLTVWLQAHGEKKAPAAPRPTGSAGSGPIAEFNDSHDPGGILEAHGYTRAGKRWIAPDSTTMTPGVVLLPDSDPPRVYSHHGADPLGDGHSHDAFSVYTVLEHGGDQRAALQAIGGESRREYADILADADALTKKSDPTVIHNLVVESGPLSAIEQRKVFDVIKRKTGTPLGTLKEALREAATDGPDHLTLARRIVDHKGADNVLSADSFVWQWDDCGVWRKCEPRTVRRWVQHGLAETEEVSKSLVDSVADLFITEVFQPGHRFDVGPEECVNTPSGEVRYLPEFGGWNAEPHQRGHYRTTQIPVKYDPSADAPRFQQFLGEIFPGPDGPQQAAALLEMIGYTLMAHCRHERFIILVGSGANGKSVLLSVLEALCGSENVAGVQPAQFANKFQRAHLHNKLANIVTEIEQGEVIDDAALKGIVSGEPTTVEHKFKDPFQMRPFSTCWFGTNHMPHTRDFSDALFRRALILKFDAVFKPEHGNCDPNLKHRLMDELPGILNMALDHYAHAVDHGFTMPESSRQAREEWRLEADQVAQFVESECQRSDTGEVRAQPLYSRYKEWAEENGIHRTLSMKSFRDRLTKLGFGAARRMDGRYVTGMTCRSVPDFRWCAG